MADQNDRNQGSDHDDLYDDAAPRSIFAATWFRAVLVLIVLGVIGAVAVPYILDAMNAPPPKTAATKPVPAPSAPSAPTPAATPPAAVTPPAPPAVVSPTPTPPPPPVMQSQMPDKPGADKLADKKDSMVAATTAAPEPPKAEPKPAPRTEPKPEPKAPPAPTAKGDAPSKPAAKATARAASAPSKTGQWYVQVGAFKDSATATRVATRLRDDNYKVAESERGTAAATVASATTSTPSSASSASDQYDVIIAGQSPADLTKRLAAKGLTAESTPNGAVVKPSLPLRDAVALSKDLAVDGLKVQVRRAGGTSVPAPRPSSAASRTSGDGDGLHRVSVGGFADRSTAVATLKELEGKGYKPFLTRR